MDRARWQILVVGGIVLALSIGLLVVRWQSGRSGLGGLSTPLLTVWLFHALWEKRPWARPVLLVLAGAAIVVIAAALWRAHTAAVGTQLQVALAAAWGGVCAGMAIWLLASRALREHLRGRLPFAAIARLAPRITVWRAGRPLVAELTPLGEIACRMSIRVADPEQLDDTHDVPVAVPPGRHAVHAYRWRHPDHGEIDVALVVSFRRPWLATVDHLEIGNDIRDDLDGVMVDSAEIAIRGDDPATAPVRVASGLGDGCYPVYAVKQPGGGVCAIVVDLLLWKQRRYALFGDQRLDEYGLVVRGARPAGPDSAGDGMA